jgi:hypothetical protein
VEVGRLTQAEATTRLANLRSQTTQNLTRAGWPIPPARPAPPRRGN